MKDTYGWIPHPRFTGPYIPHISWKINMLFPVCFSVYCPGMLPYISIHGRCRMQVTSKSPGGLIHSSGPCSHAPRASSCSETMQQRLKQKRKNGNLQKLVMWFKMDIHIYIYVHLYVNTYVYEKYIHIYIYIFYKKNDLHINRDLYK